MRPIMMPPAPEQSQASAEASAGTERAPPTSAAISFSATAVIQAAPKAIIMATSATEATTQEARLSMDAKGDRSIEKEPGGLTLLQAAHDLTTHAGARAALSAALRNVREPRQTPNG